MREKDFASPPDYELQSIAHPLVWYNFVMIAIRTVLERNRFYEEVRRAGEEYRVAMLRSLTLL